MKILHLSAECYPAAKVGGLADVMGALPKYLNRQGINASVMMPGYATEWIKNHTFTRLFDGNNRMGEHRFEYAIQKLNESEPGFRLYVTDIPEYFDRQGIYTDPFTGIGYRDEAERFLSFQIAVLDWLMEQEQKPDLIHCHDHHTALVPFMMTQCYAYRELKSIPTVLTVHNADYQGICEFNKRQLLPPFDIEETELLKWDGRLNSLAAGLKCAWQISSVSKTYLQELSENSNGLESLFQREKEKSTGIVNGIDTEVWNPVTDDYLDRHYSVQDSSEGKRANKKELCATFGLNSSCPTVSFIGRLVQQKGADLLPDLFKSFLDEKNRKVNFIVLGTGDPELHERFHLMNEQYVGFFDATIDYNEQLAHQIYAGSDFMIMPSRYEPCGLNQMYAMRYGTIPVVRETGGLKDTVIDLKEKNGYGFTFKEFSLEAAGNALSRALKLYEDKNRLRQIREKIMKLDFSWNASAKEYISMYTDLLDLKKSQI